MTPADVHAYVDEVTGIQVTLNNGTDGILLLNFFSGRKNGKAPPSERMNEFGDRQTILTTYAE